MVVAHTTGGQRIQNYLTRVFEGGHRVELVLVEDYKGTVETLLEIRPRIKNDFILLPCDLLTDYPLGRLLERWRVTDARLLCVLTTPIPANFGQQPKESTEPKHRLSDEGGIVVGLDKDRGRILSWAHRDDLEGGEVSLRMALLMRFPYLRLCTDLQDVHLYIFRKDIVASAIDDGIPSMSDAGEDELFNDLFSVREDLVPRLVRRQLGREDYYRVEALIVETGYCVRASTLSALAESSKQMVRMGAASGAVRLISQAAEIGVKAQIGSDSLIGDHSKVGEKSSIKRSVIGNHVVIGNNVKISNSLVLDHTLIEDNVKLEGCIVGTKAVIREKCYLKDCDIGGEHIVERETACKGEILGGSRDIYLDDDPGDVLSGQLENEDGVGGGTM